MSDPQNDEYEIPKLRWNSCLTWIIACGFLVFAFALLFPDYAWTGGAWITIEVQVIDAASEEPVADANVVLIADTQMGVNQHDSSPAKLEGTTDRKGRTELKYGFGAGGGRWNTTIVVNASSIRALAPGYAEIEVPVSETGKIQFRHFPFTAPRSQSTEVLVAMTPPGREAND